MSKASPARRGSEAASEPGHVHEFCPPNVVRHLTRNWAGFTRIEIVLDGIVKNNQPMTRIKHGVCMNLPFFLKPFKKLLYAYLDLWLKQLWAEDYPMMERRHKVLEAGFKDHPLDPNFKAVEGFLSRN